MKAFKRESDLIKTAYGIGDTISSTIIAEIGTDMSQFPNESILSSRAGICPGNNERAGVKKKERFPKATNSSVQPFAKQLSRLLKKRFCIQRLLQQYRQTKEQEGAGAITRTGDADCGDERE
jgi:transposase